MQNMGNRIVSIFYNVESSLGRVIVIWDKKSFFLQFVKISDRQRHFYFRKTLHAYYLISNIYYLLEHLSHSSHFWHNCCFTTNKLVKSHFVIGITQFFEKDLN